jgi:hypothetical protein
LENYLSKNHLDHQCLLIRTEVMRKVGGYDERFPRSQDCDLMVRLMLGTSSWVYVDKPLFFFEKHEKGQTKGLASIYGKTLWTLKNQLNATWLFPYMKTPAALLAYIQAFNTFLTDPAWSNDAEKLRAAAKNVADEITEQSSEPAPAGFAVVKE